MRKKATKKNKSHASFSEKKKICHDDGTTNVRSRFQVDVVLADAHVICLSLFSSFVYYRNHSIIFSLIFFSFFYLLLLHSNRLSHFPVRRTRDALLHCIASFTLFLLANRIFSRIIFTQCNIKYFEDHAQLMYTLAKYLRSVCISILTRRTNKQTKIYSRRIEFRTGASVQCTCRYWFDILFVCAPFACNKHIFFASEI